MKEIQRTEELYHNTIGEVWTVGNSTVKYTGEKEGVREGSARGRPQTKRDLKGIQIQS